MWLNSRAGSCRSLVKSLRNVLEPVRTHQLSSVNLVKNHNFSIVPQRALTSINMPTYTADYLSDKLKKELDAKHIEIEDLSNCGCGMKFDAILVSSKFDGKPILQRQRLVNQILAEEMKHIHAFTMKTLTPEQWDTMKSTDS